MGKSIAVVHGNDVEREDLCTALRKHRYQVRGFSAVADFEAHPREIGWNAVIIDLDGLPVDNRFIGKLRKDNPSLCIIGTSSRTFHPELEESMRTHISACLCKPLDESELIYWLKHSIRGRAPRSRASPRKG